MKSLDEFYCYGCTTHKPMGELKTGARAVTGKGTCRECDKLAARNRKRLVRAGLWVKKEPRHIELPIKRTKDLEAGWEDESYRNVTPEERDKYYSKDTLDNRGTGKKPRNGKYPRTFNYEAFYGDEVA